MISTKKSKVKQTSSANADLSAQIKSIDRLLDREDFDNAEQKLRKVLSSHSKHSGLWHRLFGVLEERREPWAMAMAAYEWTQAMPNSSRAWGALTDYSKNLGLLALADNAILRYLELGGSLPKGAEPPLSPEEWMTVFSDPYEAPATKEELVQLDLGQIYLQNRKHRQCIKTLAPLSLIPARNNRALAHFYLGDVEAAYNEFLSSWQAHPHNLFALGWLAKLNLWHGDTEALQSITRQLKAARAIRILDALIQIEALLWVQEHQAAWQLCQEYQKADWWDECHPHMLILAAAGATKCGATATAKTLLKQALTSDNCPAYAESNLQDLDRSPKERQGQTLVILSVVIPLAWFGSPTQNRAKFGKEKLSNANALFEKFSQISNLYLTHLFNIGDELIRRVVLEVLQMRVANSDQEAAQSLVGLLQSHQGTLSERMGIAEALVELKLLDRGQPCRLWTGEAVSEVSIIKQEVFDEPVPSNLTESAQQELVGAMALLHAGKMQQAQIELERLLKQYPMETSLYTNLAYIHSSLGGNEKEVERLMKQAVEVNPDYLIGRCNLAGLMLGQGRFDEAEALLKGLGNRERLHIDEAFAYHAAVVQLSLHKADYETARSMLKSMERFVNNDLKKREVDHLQQQLELMKNSKLLAAVKKVKSLFGGADSTR